MTQMVDGNYETAEAFVHEINAARRRNPKGWIGFVGEVAGKRVRVKTYSTTYLQKCEVDGIEHAAPMEMNVGEWKAFLLKALT